MISGKFYSLVSGMFLLLVSVGFSIIFAELVFNILKTEPNEERSSKWLEHYKGSFLDCMQLDQKVIYRPKEHQNKDGCARTDKFGFRPSGIFVPSNGIEILLLGDSFTWGHGVEEQQTYPGHLQKLFNESDISVDVQNAGVPGYGTDQQVVFFEKIILPKFKPDIVVWNINENDIWDNDWACLFSVKNNHLLQYPGSLNAMYLLGNASLFLNKIGYESSIFNFFKNKIPNRWTFGCSIDGYDWQFDSYRKLKRTLTIRKMQKLSEDYDFGLLITYVQGPYAYTESERPDDYNPWSQDDIANITHDVPNILLISKEIKNFLAMEHLATIISSDTSQILGISGADLSQALFLEDKDFDPGSRHMNSQGNYLFSEIVYKQLQLRFF